MCGISDAARADLSPDRTNSGSAPAQRGVLGVAAALLVDAGADSISVSGIAARLTLTNGLSARAEALWIACASISLPVPVSPVSSTVTLCRAARRASSLAWAMAEVSPTKSSKVKRALRGCDNCRLALRSSLSSWFTRAISGLRLSR